MRVYTNKDFSELALKILYTEIIDIPIVLQQCFIEAGQDFSFLQNIGNAIRNNIQSFSGKENEILLIEEWRQKTARKFRIPLINGKVPFAPIMIPEKEPYDNKFNADKPLPINANTQS